MKPDPRFQGQEKTFWAYVRSISQWVGYTDRSTQKIKVPTANELRACLVALQLAPDVVVSEDKTLTALGIKLRAYFEQRALVLNTEVEPALMHAAEAEALFKRLRKSLRSSLPIAMNKQKGKKKKPAYLTGMVGMLIESSRGRWPCDYDPRALTAFTQQGVPVRTLSRRVDGAFPAVINPVAIWEIKEYSRYALDSPNS
jgi:hypothetical protein